VKWRQEISAGRPTAPELARYRCFLPDLAGLAGFRRVGPGTLRVYHPKRPGHGMANSREYTSPMLPPQRPSSRPIDDPVPDPEPASPSLPGPDPAVFHPDPCPKEPAEGPARA